jgi:deoxycytidylate deaminase
MPSGEPNVCELADGTTDPRVRHAEINALRKLIKSAESSTDSVLFCTDAPCPICAIELAESGVAAVYYQTLYHNTSGIANLVKRGVPVFRVDMEHLEIRQHILINGELQEIMEHAICQTNML